MHHYINAITNKKGDALSGYFVRCVDSVTGSPATLYADTALTPILSVSGVANAAKVDADGNASFYIATGSYHLDIYATDSTTFVRRIQSIPMVEDLSVPTATTIGLFSNASSQVLGSSITLVQTTGYSALDSGAAIYAYDATVDSAYVTANPRTSFLTSNGRGFKLSKDQLVTAEMLGALGNGTADDGPIIQAAFNAGVKEVRLGYKNYRIATTITLPAYGALSSYEKAVVTKGANIDLFDMSAQACQLKGLSIQGAGATYTGRGVVINSGSSSYDQKILDTDILDMNGYCLEFVGADAGQRFEGRGSNFLRTTTDNPAIKMPAATDTAGGNRTFTDCGTVGGGRLFDLDHAANTGIVNCQMVTLTFSQFSSRTRMTGCRIAALSGTLTIDGYDNMVAGNVIAGAIQIAATAQRCSVGPNNLLAGASITDLSTATGDNINYIYDANGLSFTPVWGQTVGTGPAIGNGTISGRLYRNGRQYTVRISIGMGSTTTFGDATGDWTFSLPSPDNRLAKFAAIGDASALDSTATVFRMGAARIAAGASTITVRNTGTGTGWKQGVPQTWASGHSLDITIAYEVG